MKRDSLYDQKPAQRERDVSISKETYERDIRICKVTPKDVYIYMKRDLKKIPPHMQSDPPKKRGCVRKKPPKDAYIHATQPTKNTCIYMKRVLKKRAWKQDSFLSLRICAMSFDEKCPQQGIDMIAWFQQNKE